jgi:hypothetical protein
MMRRGGLEARLTCIELREAQGVSLSLSSRSCLERDLPTRDSREGVDMLVEEEADGNPSESLEDGPPLMSGCQC